ncbi:hypothetical protein QJS10_CPA01g01028 [Acorus calamus]|uniref:Sulfite exporter TauE/SafE family protein n=1 Tax=Acorus calamus TaxID=4465 RepID=A0AAV9FQY7_ACOCL|nr:hypothetical protein QJS10_CPA01g01028 [Acorus calamus]
MKGLLFLKWLFFSLSILTIPVPSTAKETQSISQKHDVLTTLINQVLQWRETQMSSQHSDTTFGLHTVLAGVLCFVASSISSAGGVGGGSLFLPILNLVAGLDLKKATTFSAFMVTGGSISNVMYNMCFKKSLIDYDIALLSQPCMLLGVSVGVISNVVFPEWLMTALFVLFLGCSTYKTCRAGVSCWKAESENVERHGCVKLESGLLNGEGERESESGLREPLLEEEEEMGRDMVVRLKKNGLLIAIWVAFFVVHLLRGDKHGESLLPIEQCGVVYWLLSGLQIPLTVVFTAYILYQQGRGQHQSIDRHEDNKNVTMHSGIRSLSKFTFPVAALISGVLGGLFGIGGGLVMNPVLLQIGVPPQITAATTSFMVFFSSSMSSFQYLTLGMKGINHALIFAALCFLASLIGLVLIQKLVGRLGRASLIIFSVSIVMALSTVSITCFGAIDVWTDLKNGKYMGFKLPC